MPKQQFFETPRVTNSRRFLRWSLLGCITFLMAHTLGSMFLQPMLPIIMLLLEGATVIYCMSDLLRKPERYFSFLSRPKHTGSWMKASLYLLSLSLVLVGIVEAPAHAAFYSAAETFVSSSFPAAATAVPLVFNALRAILILYIGISLVSVLNAARQGEEWMTLARTPIAAIVIVAVGDVLTTIII